MADLTPSSNANWATLPGENALHQAGALPLSPRLNYVHHAYTTWNGYVDNHLKSAIQKLIRRSSPAQVEGAIKALGEGQLWPLVYFVVELDLFKTVTFPGPLADAYVASKNPKKPLSDGVRTNLENRLRVIALEDIGMANPLLCAAIEQALPIAKVKIGGGKDSSVKDSSGKDSKTVNGDNPKALLQVAISQAASPKCRLYSHLKTLFALPPYYWDSSHDKSARKLKEAVHQKADRLRALWLTLTPHVQGVDYPANLSTLHTKPEAELKAAFVEGVKAKKIEAFAYLSAALYGVYTVQGTQGYDPKAKSAAGLVSTLAFKCLLNFCEAALAKVRDELNEAVKETIRVMKLWFKKMTHAEKPLYLYHAISLMIFRDDLTTSSIPDLIPLTDHQTSILYKANLGNPPPATGVPLPIPAVAQDVHTSAAGRNTKNKDIVDFAMSGSYVAFPSSNRGCGLGQWQDVYKVYKMGQVAAKVMTDDAAAALLALVKPYRNHDLSEDETKTLKAAVKGVLDPLLDAIVADAVVADTGVPTRPKAKKRISSSRDGNVQRSVKSRLSRKSLKPRLLRSKKRAKIPKCTLDQTQLDALMAAKPGGALPWIGPETALGKDVVAVIARRLLAQSRCGTAKLFTLVGKDVIVKGPLGLKSPKKLVLNLGLNFLLEQLETDSGLGDERMGGIMPLGLYKNKEGLWIVWPNLGPTYSEDDTTVKTTKVDTDYKVVDRAKKDIRISTAAKANVMTPKEAKATLQHLYWRSILMGGDSGGHNVIRTSKGDRPIGGIDLEEIRGESSMDSEDPWLILFKARPDKKQVEAFSPYLKTIVKMDALSPAFVALADTLSTIAPHCGLEPGQAYVDRLAHVNKVLFGALSGGSSQSKPGSLKLASGGSSQSKPGLLKLATKPSKKRLRDKPVRVRAQSRSVSPLRTSKSSLSTSKISDFTPLPKDRVKLVL